MNAVRAALMEKKEKEAFSAVKKIICETASQMRPQEMEWLVMLEEWWYDRHGKIHPAEPAMEAWSGRCDCVVCLYPVRDGYCLYDSEQEEVPCAFGMVMEICSEERESAILFHGEYEQRMKGQIMEMLAELEKGKERYVQSEMSAESLQKNAKLYQVTAWPVKL